MVGCAGGKYLPKCHRHGGVYAPTAYVPDEFPAGYHALVEECEECAAKKPYHNEICAKVHENSLCGVGETRCAEKMHGIVCRQNQQCRPHEGSRHTIVAVNVQIGQFTENEAVAEKQHQRQRHA